MSAIPVAAPASDVAVNAALTFIVPQNTKPYFKSAALTGGDPEVHFQTELREVEINDMRHLAPAPNLDQQGFELLTAPTKVVDLYEDDTIATAYSDELIALLKAATGADEAVIFDATRRSDSTAGAPNPDGQRGPANRVHVDYTVASGPKRAADALGEDLVERVLANGGRIVQINVWRPIRGPVQRAPLALADASSIDEKERVATDQLFPDRVGEIYHIAHGADQKWYWAPEMARDEVLLIKGWDSLDDGRARFTPHGAFALPGPTDGLPPRESIEVRTYALFEGRLG